MKCFLPLKMSVNVTHIGQNDRGLMIHVAKPCWEWFMPSTGLYLLWEKKHNIHMYTTSRQSREMCFSDSVSNHCVWGWKESSALVIMMFFLILIRFSWVNGRIGSNPLSHGCGRACVRRVWTRAPTREIPPPSCVDYLHCSNGISSHRL